MTRNACLVASLFAFLLAGLFVGGAGAQSSARSSSAPNPLAFDCAGPSANDVADSDFFWYWPCASFLHVSVSPANEAIGYVRSTPYAIDCPHACTRPFAEGTQVKLTAYPSEGATFSGWSGAACVGQGNPCLATVNGDTQVMASFGGVPIAPSPPQTASSLVTLTTFMGNASAATVTGTGGFSCSFSVCHKNYAPNTTVTLSVSGPFGAPFFFCDSTTGVTQHSTPYTFTIANTRSVTPHSHGVGTC